MSAAIDQAWVTARKAHRCTDCGGVIAAGDRYQRQTSVDGDGFATYKAHDLCFTLFCDSGSDGEDWTRDCATEALSEWWWAFAALFAPTPEALAVLDFLAVVPTNTGGLQIEWHTLAGDTEIEVAADGTTVGMWTERARPAVAGPESPEATP